MTTIERIMHACNDAARGEITNAVALGRIHDLCRQHQLDRCNSRIEELKVELTAKGVDVDSLLAQLEAKKI